MTQRQAGIFTAPPAMFEAIRDWMVSTYAGHILAGVREDLIRARDAMAPIKGAMADLRHTLGSVSGEIAGLQVGKAVRYPVYSWNGWSKTVDSEVLGIRRKGPDLYEIGYGEKAVSYRPRSLPREFWGLRGGLTGDAAAAKVTAFLSTRIRRLESALTNPANFQTTEDATLVELALLEKEAAQYASQAKSYKTSTKKKFRIDLAGWQYIEDVGAAHATLKAAGWDKITAVLDFYGSQYKGGHWSRKDRVLNVGIGHGSAGRFVMSPGEARSVSLFRFGISEIERVLRHELQHVGQDVLAVVRGLSEDAGLPSRSLRNLDYSPGGVSLDVNEDGTKFVKTHPLRDVEFYTRLADEVDTFVRMSREIPLDMRREAMRVWVAASPDTTLERDGETVVGTRQFFYSMKKYEPEKWRKAVGEFFDEVEQKVRIPADAAARLAHRFAAAQNY